MERENFSDENLEKLADILSGLNETQKSKLESLLQARSTGIKKTKIVERFSRKTVGESGKIREEEEDTSLDSDGGILTKRIREMKVFDCRHPASMENFGHVAECGHIICKNCVEKYELVCAKPGCLKKLCTKPRCPKKMMRGKLYCRKHGWLAFFGAIGDFLFSPRRDKSFD